MKSSNRRPKRQSSERTTGASEVESEGGLCRSTNGDQTVDGLCGCSMCKICTAHNHLDQTKRFTRCDRCCMEGLRGDKVVGSFLHGVMNGACEWELLKCGNIVTKGNSALRQLCIAVSITTSHHDWDLRRAKSG